MKKRITGVLAAGLLLFGNEMASWLALLVLAALGLDLVFVGAPLSGAVFKPPPLGEVARRAGRVPAGTQSARRNRKCWKRTISSSPIQESSGRT